MTDNNKDTKNPSEQNNNENSGNSQQNASIDKSIKGETVNNQEKGVNAEGLQRKTEKGPLSREEILKNKKDENRKNLKVIQVAEHPDGRIQVYPLQNIKYKSDVSGLLYQALSEFCNDDIIASIGSLITQSKGKKPSSE